jgi:hypothetical protein
VTSDEDEDEELLDEDEEARDEAGEAELFARPGDSEYDRIKFFSGLESLPKSFQGAGALSREYLKQRYSAFAVRFTGGDERTGGFDPEFFTKRVLRAARLNRWVANAYAPANPPGVFATVPGSLVAHFTIAAGEEPARLGGHREYPTIAGARAVARLLAYAGDESALLEAVHPLGKLAVRSLLAALDDAVELDLTMNWLTREGLYSSVGPKRAERGVEILSVVPAMVTRAPQLIAGQLDRPDKGRGRVRMQPLRGAPMLLHYPPELEDRIREAWGKYMVGTMIVEEPENPSLPRAPKRVRTLRRIRRIYDTEEELARALDR